MNYKIVVKTLGKVLLAIAALLLLPVALLFIYNEFTVTKLLAFILPATGCAFFGALTFLIKNKDKSLYAKEGLLIVGFGWIILCIVGAFPFYISLNGASGFEDITFFDCLFESTSGFTTTGASIFHSVTEGHQIDLLYDNGYKALLFFRSLTHWIGGMGVIIFLVAVVPSEGKANSIHLMQAESTGASVDKITAKMGGTARFLYIMYAALTVIQIIMLLLAIPFDPEMNVFHAVVLSLGTAGTGGFAATSTSLAGFTPYVKITVAVFMFLFGINFSIYFFILTGKFRDIVKNEEVNYYFAIVISVFLLIALSLVLLMKNVYTTFSEALLDSSFTTISLMTSTGYATADFTSWPAVCRGLLIFVMFVGACAGSTGGGFKVSRFIILIKSGLVQLRKTLNPRSVTCVKMNGKKLDDSMVSGVQNYFIVYAVIMLVSVLLVLTDLSVSGAGDFDTAFSSVLACFNNVGPGMTFQTGPNGSFHFYSWPSKILFTFLMLLGRLEIYPILMLFTKRTYLRGA